MTFETFQNDARLFVIGALEPDEIKRFELGKERYGSAAQVFLDECNRLREGFQLSIKPVQKTRAIRAQLLSMISRRNPTLSRR